MRAAGMLRPPLLTNSKNEFYQFKDFSLNMHSKETISKSEFSLVSITVYTGELGWRGSATRLCEISEGFLPPLSLIAGLSGIP